MKNFYLQIKINTDKSLTDKDGKRGQGILRGDLIFA